MDLRSLKSLVISVLLHTLIFLLMLLITLNTSAPLPEQKMYREVSFVVESPAPEVIEDAQTSLAQEQVVKQKVEPVPKKTPPEPKQKVELPTVKAKKLEPKMPDKLEPKNQEPEKIFIPDKTDDKQVKESAVKDTPGGEFGDSGANINPEKNVEIFGPIVNRSIVYSEVPDYPDWAKRQGIESEVRMKFWVEPSGEVVNIDVIQKSGYLRLDLLAKNSLAKWKFTTLDSKVPQIKQWGEIVVRFVLY